jgi:hypothetical protein
MARRRLHDDDFDVRLEMEIITDANLTSFRLPGIATSTIGSDFHSTLGVSLSASILGGTTLRIVTCRTPIRPAWASSVGFVSNALVVGWWPVWFIGRC